MKRRSFLAVSSLSLASFGAGVFYWPRRWNYIIIHHSAGNYGDIEFLKKVHRERQKNDPIDAIPYHYVIGNGNGIAEGKIEKGWRQKHNIWGAHLSMNNALRNLNGIGICLIGNFEKNNISSIQYDAAVALTKMLMNRYSIPISNVTGHGFTHGEQTICPGNMFPMERFLIDIQQS